jgi:hypothetical protein
MPFPAPKRNWPPWASPTGSITIRASFRAGNSGGGDCPRARPRPALLFADEPTGNLDAATGAVIADLLFARAREAEPAC